MKLFRSVPKFRFEPSESSSDQRRNTTVHEIASGAAQTSGSVVTGLLGDNGKLSDGITFTAGQTRDIPHGLGRAPKGFMVLDATGSAPQLYRTRVEDSESKLIRLTHSGASSTTVKLLIL